MRLTTRNAPARRANNNPRPYENTLQEQKLQTRTVSVFVGVDDTGRMVYRDKYSTYYANQAVIDQHQQRQMDLTLTQGDLRNAMAAHAALPLALSSPSHAPMSDG